MDRLLIQFGFIILTMKASKYIEILKNTIEKHGDIEVFFREKGCGGHALFVTNCEFGVKTITPHNFDGNNEPSYETINELFPGANLSEDQDVYEWIENCISDYKCKYITITNQDMIYST